MQPEYSHSRIRRNLIPGAIARDRDNDIWIGTYGEGLNLYDAKKNRFLHYRQRANDANTLSSNNIQILLADSKGLLWIGTIDNGLNLYDKKTNSFTRFIHDENKNSLSNNTINHLLEDSHGNIWIATAIKQMVNWTGIQNILLMKTGNQLKKFNIQKKGKSILDAKCFIMIMKGGKQKLNIMTTRMR